MRKLCIICYVLFLSFLSLIVVADNYKILDINTSSVRIGNRNCVKGDVFSDLEDIAWSYGKQAFKAQNLTTKEIRLFTAPEFLKSQSMTIKDYYIKNNRLSTRTTWVNLAEMGALLADTFYLYDTLYIDFPVLDEFKESIYASYTSGNCSIKRLISIKEKQLVIDRSFFPNIDKDDSVVNLSLLVRRESNNNYYLIKDSIKIVILPLRINEWSL